MSRAHQNSTNKGANTVLASNFDLVSTLGINVLVWVSTLVRCEIPHVLWCKLNGRFFIEGQRKHGHSKGCIPRQNLTLILYIEHSGSVTPHLGQYEYERSMY